MYLLAHIMREAKTAAARCSVITEVGPYWTSGACKCRKVSGGTRNAIANSCNTLTDAVCSNPNDCASCTCASLPQRCERIGSPPCCACPAGSRLTCSDDFDCTTCRCELQAFRYADCCSCAHLGPQFALSDKCHDLGANRQQCRCRKPKGANPFNPGQGGWS